MPLLLLLFWWCFVSDEMTRFGLRNLQLWTVRSVLAERKSVLHGIIESMLHGIIHTGLVQLVCVNFPTGVCADNAHKCCMCILDVALFVRGRRERLR